MAGHPDRSLGAKLAQYAALTCTVLLALFNGSLFSPLYDSADQLIYLSSRSSLHLGPLPLQPYRTSVFLAVMTLLIGGIPAALYERVRRLGHGTLPSAVLWLATTFLLTLPALMRAFELD